MTNERSNEIKFEHSNKICFRQKSITKGVSWSHYENEHDRLYYQNENQHTLSMYLAGGHETHRTDINSDFGAPGKYCLMPKGSESHWQLGTPQQFMHLYFDDDYLKRLAIRVLDMDPRLVQLPQLTFSDNPGLASLVSSNIAHIDWSSDHMAMEQVTNTILVTILQSTMGSKKFKQVKGGLAPGATYKVCEFIQANYQRQIFLYELAGLANLSEYHFCRMFKESMAQTPQDYLNQVRIDRAKGLIDSSSNNLAEIALQCGFSSQSHLGRSFKKLVGIAPGAYRRQRL